MLLFYIFSSFQKHSVYQHCLIYWTEKFLWEYSIYLKYFHCLSKPKIAPFKDTHLHEHLCTCSPGKPRWDYKWAVRENGAPQGRKWAPCDHTVRLSHPNVPPPLGSGIPSPSRSGTGTWAWLPQRHLTATGWHETCFVLSLRPSWLPGTGLVPVVSPRVSDPFSTWLLSFQTAQSNVGCHVISD